MGNGERLRVNVEWGMANVALEYAKEGIALIFWLLTDINPKI